MAVIDTSDLTSSVDPAAPGVRWAAVGHSDHPDARTAVAAAYSALDLAAEPVLLMMFVSPSVDVDAVAASVGDLAPGVPVVGCTSFGEISAAGQQDGSVVLMALGGAGIRCTTALAHIVDGDARAAARTAARCIDGLDGLGSSVLLVLADGGGIDQDDLVRGAYDAVGPSVPLVGGCASGTYLQDDLTIFHRAAGPGARVEIADGAVVVTAITSAGPIGVGVGHGFEAAGDPHVVTASGSNIVETLDEQPALDAYLRHHGATDAVFDEPDGFMLLSHSRPLGVSRRSRVEPRAIIGADREARTLLTGAAVPQGGLVWLLDGNTTAALDAVDQVADDALAALGDAPAVAALVFDCGGRRAMLGPDNVALEVQRFAERAGCPMAGLYTFGEIARTSGSSGFHNLTAVMVAFG